jgi:pimeloyl-ACP methyl ester carboxylesterase
MALSSFLGGRIWGTRHGAGPPQVLALHGWGRDHHDFDTVLEGFPAVAVDLPGHGVAPDPPAAWSTREYAEWVAPLLADLGPPPLVVVGHSFGGRVALHLATIVAGPGHTQPDPLSALVLTGVPFGLPSGRNTRGPNLAYRIGRGLHRAGLLPEARMEHLRQKYGSQDYRRASPVMRGVLVKAVRETSTGSYHALLRAWAGAGHQVELIWGEMDTVAPQAAARTAAEGLPSVHMTVLAGTGHIITPRLAEELRSALLRCLGQTGQTGPGRTQSGPGAR